MKSGKRVLSVFLSLMMVLSMMPAFSVAVYAETVFAEESEAVSEEIKNSGNFYVATPNIYMTEGANARYAAKIRRGGDNLEAAEVRLTIVDITAQYGRDYTIEVPSSGIFDPGIENASGSGSLYSVFRENNGKLDEINGYDEISRLGKTDEEIQEMYNEDLQDLSEDLGNELETYVAEKSEETGMSEESVIEEANQNNRSSLSEAFEAATGFADDSVPMDGGGENAAGILDAYTGDRLAELARELDSPYLVLGFDEGETEKVIEIIPKDNHDSEGDKMFLASLYPESDNAVISEIKGITATIQDDEQWSEPVVEFAESVYYPENGFADITIKREGILTDVAAVKLSTSDGTALEGRDYSQVDTTVVFPFGISERTIKVPVSSESIDTAADFELMLSDAMNCTLGENSRAKGIVEANSVSFKDTESGEVQLMADAGVSDVIVSDREALSHKSPYSSSAQDKGYAKAEGDNFVLYACTSIYDKVWARAYWNTKDNKPHYDYDGYQIEWTKESGKPCYTDNEVKLYYGGDWHTVWENREERWSKKNTLIYPKQNEFQYLKISVSREGAFFGTSPTMKIHSIKPVLRPFEVSLKGAEPLQFRNEKGELVDNTRIAALSDATGAVLQGANNTGTGTAVKFSGEKITVTTTSKYAYISGLKIVHPSNGKSKLVVSGLPSGTTSASIDLNNDFIKKNLDYVNFAGNGGYRIKGQFMVQPVFDYYRSSITLHGDQRAVIELNNEEGTTADRTVTVHRGDSIRFTQKINDEYKSIYSSSRIRLVKRVTSAENPLDDKSLYNDGSDSYRMMCDYASVNAYVNLDKKDNQVIVRVAESDIDLFDTSAGIFKNNYVTYGKFRDYTIVPTNQFSVNSYVEMEASAKNDGYIPVWTSPWDTRSCSQSAFYFETKEEAEDNIITLTCKKADSRRYSITGTSHYSEMALSGGTEGASWRPAAGMYLSLGKTAYGISGDDGYFSTVPVYGIKGYSVVYKTESNGRTSYGTVVLDDAVTGMVDNGNGGTDTVNTVSIGDIKVSLTDSSAPYVSTFTATNINGVVSGDVALISDDITYLTATVMNNKSAYTDADGEERAESVKKVEFVIYDSRTNTEKSVVEEEAKEISNNNGISVWQLAKAFKKSESHLYTSSDRIYVRVTTDRVKGNGTAYDEKGVLIRPDALNETQYPAVYTGYTLATTSMEKPVTNDIDIFNDNLDQFLTLPVIGSMNSTFMVKSIALSISELPDGGFRLGLGYVVGRKTADPDDGDKTHQTPLTPSGIASEIKKAGNWGQKIGPKNAVGIKGGGIYPMFGIYLDFGLKQINHMDDQHSTSKKLVFLGGGAMLGATGEYRLVIYGAIGPVPVYFGIDGSLAVFADIGFKLKNEDSLGDDAKEYEDVTFEEIKSGDKTIEESVLFDFALQAHGSLAIYVGAGIAGTFGVRGGAQVSASFIYYPTITETYDVNPVGLQITVGLRIWVDVVLFSIPSPQLELANERLGYYKDIDRLKENNGSLFSESLVEPQTDEYGAVLRKSSGREEKWLPDSETADLMSTFEIEKSTILSTDGYENASPQLMDLGGGRILLVYLASDLSKGDYDRTSIVYNIYDNGQWMSTEPVKIDADSTRGDFEPNLCDIGDQILISWISGNDGNTETDSEEYLKGLNVFTTTIDKDTLALGEIVQLTDDDYYNCHPVGVYDEKSGDYIVFFMKSDVRDDAGTDFLTTASPTTNGAKQMYMLYDNQKSWLMSDDTLSGNEKLAAGWEGQRFLFSPIDEMMIPANSYSPRIIDFDGISFDGRGVYAYTIDLDNNIDTMNDREVYVQIYDFEEHMTYRPIRMTRDNYADTAPQLVRYGDHAYLFWRQGENTIRYISIEHLVKNGLQPDGILKDSAEDSDGTTPFYEMEQSVVFSAMEDPDVQPSYANYKVFVDKDDNMFIAWTQGEENEDGQMSQEVYASAFIKETENADDKATVLESSWSEGVRLTESGAYNDGIAVWTDANGNLVTVNNQYEIDFSAPDGETVKNVRLVSTEYKTVGSAEVNKVTYDDTTPLAGSTDTVTIDVKNQGLKPMTGFTLRAYEKKNGVIASEPVFETTSGERVTPSSVVPVSFDWQMPDSFDDVTDLSLHITVQEAGYDRISEFDSDSIEFRPVYEFKSVSIQQSEDFQFLVQYELENEGNVDLQHGWDEKTADRVVMEYVDAYNTGSEKMTFLDASVPPLAAGQTAWVEKLIDIPEEGYFKYGRLNSTLEVRNGNEEEPLAQAPNVHITLDKPRSITINNDEKFYNLNEGSSMDLTAIYSDADYFLNGTVDFVSADPSVASVVDGRLYANHKGSTCVIASVNPYGGEKSIYVNVNASEDSPQESSGGGTVSAGYRITLPESVTQGSVSASAKQAKAGELVTITVTPLEGYRTETVNVTDSDGNPVEVTDNGDGTYSFTMPASGVRVDPVFVKADDRDDQACPRDDSCPITPFKDTDRNEWYHDGVHWALENGIMNGTSDSTFEPLTATTRAMIVTMLWRMEGSPQVEGSVTFKDVPDGQWYTDAIRWAAANGIVTGYGSDTFGTNDSVTREQLATILYRCSKSKGQGFNGSWFFPLNFDDADQVSEWADEAMHWMIMNGVIQGMSDKELSPQGDAVRAQVATMLMRFCEKLQA